MFSMSLSTILCQSHLRLSWGACGLGQWFEHNWRRLEQKKGVMLSVTPSWLTLDLWSQIFRCCVFLSRDFSGLPIIYPHHPRIKLPEVISEDSISLVKGFSPLPTQSKPHAVPS